VECIRLDQHTFQIQGAPELFQRRTLTGFVGVVGLLIQDYTKSPGLHGDLGGIDSVGRRPLRWLPSSGSMAEPRRALPTASRKPKGYTHQRVETIGSDRDLAEHSALEHLPERLQLDDAEHRHQQQEPPRVRDPTAVAAIRDGLEGAAQIIRWGLIGCGKRGFGDWLEALNPADCILG
jgi:hypothetical protein